MPCPERCALPIVLLVAAAAGCLGDGGGPPQEDAEPGPEGARAAPALGYACPGAAQIRDTPCPVRLEEATSGLEEPYAAMHPTRRDIVAVGVNYEPSVAESAAGGPVCRMAVFVSEDSGATWRKSLPPVPPHPQAPAGAAHCSRDPALVFDAGDGLVLGGLVWFVDGGPTAEGHSDARIFVVRSDDLGETWGEPTVLDPAGIHQDREWILRDASTGIIYVSWTDLPPEGDPKAGLAWSVDDGKRWVVLAADQRPPCSGKNPPSVIQGRPTLACGAPGEEVGTTLYLMDPAAGTLALFPGVSYPDGDARILEIAGGGLVAASAEHGDGGFFDQDARFRWSRDGGRTWGEALRLGKALGGFDRTAATWIEPDGWGGLHVIAWASRPDPTLPAGPFRTSQMRHVVLDPDGRVSLDSLLSAWSAKDVRDARPTTGGGHDYNGIAWGADRGFLAVTPGFGTAHQRVVDVVLVAAKPDV